MLLGIRSLKHVCLIRILEAAKVHIMWDIVCHRWLHRPILLISHGSGSLNWQLEWTSSHWHLQMHRHRHRHWQRRWHCCWQETRLRHWDRLLHHLAMNRNCHCLLLLHHLLWLPVCSVSRARIGPVLLSLDSIFIWLSDLDLGTLRCKG